MPASGVCLMHSPVQVKQLKPRYYHTATVFGCGPIFRMVVMFGGLRNIGGDPIAETTLLHLGEFAVWNTCLHKFPPQSEVSSTQLSL